MQRNLLVTKDGSHTLEVPALNVSYHSVYGAIQESLHVFIAAGLNHCIEKQNTTNPIRVFEMGFGTGLNVLLTFQAAQQQQRAIYYETIEAFPLEDAFVQKLNYCEQLKRPDFTPFFQQLHSCGWNKEIAIAPGFNFKKINLSFVNLPCRQAGYSNTQPFHLIYYDAFAPNAQPDLWTEAIFRKLFALLEPGGVLVTYCSKGEVRRAMQSAGFSVEKLKGPRGKREMLRSLKLKS